MDNNDITTLDTPAFTITNYTNGLKVLRLSGNKITKFPREFAENFVFLKSLYLDNNVDLDMTDGMFNSMKFLKSLSLESTGLRTIDLKWFSGLPSIEVLNLADNLLKTFDYNGLIKTLPSLKSLSIDDNKFNCDYLREMLVDLKKNTKVQIKGYNDVEIIQAYYYTRIYGITCYGYEYYEHGWYFIGPVIIVVVALITIFVLVKKDSCKICCGNQPYEGMATTRNENVLTEVTLSGSEMNVN